MVQEISPALGVIIMMNNYFHDVATALLLASGVGLWVIMKRYHSLCAQGKFTPEVAEFFFSLYEGMTKLAKFSLFWIIVGGVPRTIFYRSFEWVNAVEHLQVPALIVKHILAFAFVGFGAHLWSKLNSEVKKLKADARDSAKDSDDSSKEGQCQGT